MRIEWDEGCCASLGMCESVAPEVFAVGDDGVLQITSRQVADADRALVEEAVEACPTGALRLVAD